MAATPSLAAAPPGLVELLRDLETSLGGALAIVTGRPIADVDRLLAPLSLCAAGVHGAEIRMKSGGAVERVAPGLPASAVAAAKDVADLHPGLIVEVKSAAVAVHYRLAEAQSAEVEQRLRVLLSHLDAGLELRRGQKVFELIWRHVSKGGAVGHFMQHPPFVGHRPIMIGDDRTDLSAFAMARSLGGQGLRVAGEFFDAEQADFGGPAGVRQWLRELADRLAAAPNIGVG